MAMPQTIDDHHTSAGERPLTIDRRPLDLAFLSAQTMGDRALEAEVLGMFSKQLCSAEASLRNASSAVRKDLAHALKGTARSLGAFALAEIAARVEETPSERALIAELGGQIAKTCDFIASLNR